MYTQNDEEKWISDFYKSFVGRFMDLGAHNGLDLSTSRQLVNLGWRGICVEPSPTPFGALIKRYANHGAVTVVNCAIDTKSKLRPFYDNDGGYVSTLSKDHSVYWNKEARSCYRIMYLKTIKFVELLDCFGTDFNFLKMDIEGLDLKVLKDIPFERLPDLNMICAEYGTDKEAMLEVGRENGFQELTTTPHNLIMVR